MATGPERERYKMFPTSASVVKLPKYLLRLKTDTVTRPPPGKMNGINDARPHLGLLSFLLRQE